MHYRRLKSQSTYNTPGKEKSRTFSSASFQVKCLGKKQEIVVNMTSQNMETLFQLNIQIQGCIKHTCSLQLNSAYPSVEPRAEQNEPCVS